MHLRCFLCAFLICTLCLSVCVTGCRKKSDGGPSWGVTVELETGRDASVYQDDPAGNYGDDTDLYTGYVYPGGGYEEDIYLHFDLSCIPSNSTVVLAELWLHIWGTFNSYHTGYSLEAVDDSWDESTITWNSAPTSTEVCTFAGPADAFVGWYKITNPALTALVRDWVSTPLLNEGLAIKPLASTASGDMIFVDSSENVSGNAPYLVVHYNGAAPTRYQLTVAVDPASSGTVDISPTSPDGYYYSGTPVQLTAAPEAGYAFSNWSGDLTGSENPTTITMDSDKTVTANFVVPVTSPPIETDKDAFVYEDTPATNYGDEIDLYAGYPSVGGGYEEDSYLHFDVSSIDPGATVVYVELWLHTWGTFNTYGTGYSLRAVDDAWDEYTITWENALTLTSAQLCTFAGPEDGVVGWFKITNPALTALVQDWVSTSSLNNGLAIKPLPSTESDDEIYLDSRETADAPYLVVQYNP